MWLHLFLCISYSRENQLTESWILFLLGGRKCGQSTKAFLFEKYLLNLDIIQLNSCVWKQLLGIITDDQQEFLYAQGSWSLCYFRQENLPAHSSGGSIGGWIMLAWKSYCLPCALLQSWTKKNTRWMIQIRLKPFRWLCRAKCSSRTGPSMSSSNRRLRLPTAGNTSSPQRLGSAFPLPLACNWCQSSFYHVVLSQFIKLAKKSKNKFSH